MSRKVKILAIAVVAAFVVWFIWDAFNQPGIQDLQGGMEEVALYRNENNTGPVIRIYAVTVADPGIAEMEAYGNYMPHTKYGNTKVYFFRKDKSFPKAVSPGVENYPPQYQANLIATYEKDTMGQVTFLRNQVLTSEIPKSREQAANPDSSVKKNN